MAHPQLTEDMVLDPEWQNKWVQHPLRCFLIGSVLVSLNDSRINEFLKVKIKADNFRQVTPHTFYA